MLTTSEAAKRLKVTQRRILALIESGRLPARKMGPIWTIEEKDLALVRHRKPGRPSQQ